MNKTFLRNFLLCALVAVGVSANAATVNVTQSITANTTWTKNNVYILFGDIFVKDGATLTIEAGTLIKGNKQSLSRLVVTKTGKINANGTAAEPIVFTSNEPAGSRRRADWAGLAICGSAPINTKDGSGNSITKLLECGTGNEYEYGGNNADDSSGVLRYVRIEYAGYVCGANAELNSLTLGGVGRKTVISHIMVSYGQDDGIEFFGGNVNADHVVSYGSRDDDMDTDDGYSGKVQFGLIVRVDTIADQGDISNAFESDNDPNGTYNTPFTGAVFSNFTIVGPAPTVASTIDAKYGWAFRLRRNTGINVFNTIVLGYRDGLRIEGSGSQAKATGDTLEFKNNIIAGCKGKYAEAAFDTAYLANVATSNRVYAGNANDSLKLAAPYTPSAYDFRPQSGSPALTGASFTNIKLSDFSNTTYVGAFDGTNNWLDSWTNFSPQTTPYAAPNAIEDVVTGSIINVYPSPASDNVTLSINASEATDIQITVLDINGKVMQATATSLVFGDNNKIQFNTASYSNGVYFMNLRGNGFDTNIRFFVAR
jgi:hypothetical protein